MIFIRIGGSVSWCDARKEAQFQYSRRRRLKRLKKKRANLSSFLITHLPNTFVVIQNTQDTHISTFCTFFMTSSSWEININSYYYHC